MSNLPHRSHSLAWQLRQGLQRLGEWREYQVSKLNFNGPDLPYWPWLEPLGRGLFWVMVTALALWTAWLLYQGLAAYWRGRSLTPTVESTAPTEAALLQAAHWWREAQRLAQQEDYTAACQALYLAGLARLNDSQTVPYRPSRTDGEYLACLPTQPLRPYALLIRTHERLTFGQALATEETYQRCRRAYQEIAQS